ncbi:MAG: hypothetical protein RLZZ86_3263, partial [Cyanobacteriota bacterium]
MVWTIDHGIFILFLILNIIFGLKSSKGIKNIREYAIGDGSFNTSTIVATTVATWMCGETFFSTITETYQHGLYFLIPCILAFVMNFFIIGYFIAPRMTKFIGKLSIAEAMGDLYGPRVRLITTISGFIGVSGFIAVQLKITGIIVNYAFGLPETYGIIISGLIITLYSSLGGIKSVTFTDIVQLMTFCTIIPTLGFVVLNAVDSVDTLMSNLVTNPLFDYRKVFDFRESKSLYYLFLFCYIAIPAFNPAIFQRIAMAKNTTQVKYSFISAGFACFFIILIIYWISIILLFSRPDIVTPSEVGKHVIFD